MEANERTDEVPTLPVELRRTEARSEGERPMSRRTPMGAILLSRGTRAVSPCSCTTSSEPPAPMARGIPSACIMTLVVTSCCSYSAGPVAVISVTGDSLLLTSALHWEAQQAHCMHVQGSLLCYISDSSCFMYRVCIEKVNDVINYN